MKTPRIALSAKLSFFCKRGEDEQALLAAFRTLFPFDLAAEKIPLKRQVAQGFNEQPIVIYEVMLTLERHLNAFMRSLHERLTAQQRALLAQQIPTRLGDDLRFFIRFDKDALVKNNSLAITDSGKCFHLALSVAAYPKKRDAAEKVVKEYLLR